MGKELAVEAHASGFTPHASRTVARLLVRAPNWIGDAVMCEPALRGLRALFPSASLTLLAKQSVADLFQADRTVDRVVVYEDKGCHAGLAGKWTLAHTLRQQQFDLAVLFQNAFEAAFLTWLAGIPRRYGYATDGRTMLLTDPVRRPDPQTVTHQVVYYWDLLRPLGVTGSPSSPALSVTEAETTALDARLAGFGIGPSDWVIGVNPGSTYGGAKRWLPERFAEVAQRMSRHAYDRHGSRVAVLILGAPGEEALGREIAARIDGRSAVLSGATTIRELMAATKRCGLLLTNDTGPMHMAAAFNVPLVAVFGPTDWRSTSPYGQAQGLVREPVECSPCLLRECPIDHRCMTLVSVDRVYEAATKQLEQSHQLSAVSHDPVTHHASRITHHAPLQGVTVFLDRDGTLNSDPGYLRSPDALELFPGVPEALATLHRAGARLIIVTNQSGVARGFLTLENLEQIHHKLRHLVSAAGASIEAIYFCPHHPEEACRCRKPEIGMIEQAVRERQVNPARSYVIGDQPRDMELAKRIGARSVLVTTGEKTAPVPPEGAAQHVVPDAVLPSLREAAEWIVTDARRRCQPSALSGQAGITSAERLRAEG
jgi:heptosyltransferase II